MSSKNQAIETKTTTTTTTTTINSNKQQVVANGTEQPQTKRQKIEKIKCNIENINNIATVNATKLIISPSSVKEPSPPDIIQIDESNKKNAFQSSSSSSSSSSRSNTSSSSLQKLNNTSTHSQLVTASADNVDAAMNIFERRNVTDTFLPNYNDHFNLPSLHTKMTDFSSSKIIQRQEYEHINDGFINKTSKDMRAFEESLLKQCLCDVPESTLRKPFQSHYSLDTDGQKRIANLNEWPTDKMLQFLSNLQLLFDIYLKQNSKGYICSRIMDVCDALVRNENNLIDEIIVLAGHNNRYVQFLSSRVLASFLVIAKQEINDNWLKKLVDNLFNFERLDHKAIQKIHFSLEIIKEIVDWKDNESTPSQDEIAENYINTNIPDSTSPSTSTTICSTSSSNVNTEDHHPYLHFQQQQQRIENNYFAMNMGIDDDSTNRNALTHYHHSQDPTSHAIIANQINTNNLNEHVADMSNVNDNYPNIHRFQAIQNDYANTSYHHSTTTTSQYEALQQFENASSSSTHFSGCQIVTLTDSESFDTTHLKCLTIKHLENKWPALVKNMSSLIANHLDVENAENCVLNFLQLWENIISVKTNLSIVETQPFHALLDKFELLLNQNLSCTIYKQMLCLFNEALCYGSTLALQDNVPDETCLLAHQIVRHVKDFRILESLPRFQPENVVSLIGFKCKPIVYLLGSMHTQITTLNSPNPLIGGNDTIEMDKTILQKMVLLVLKSIAVTVKEIRSDSSDSSIDSTDYDAFQDMVLIERSIRDVLRKLENFIKLSLEFHPECHFSKILIYLFDDQDDHLIEAMVCTLDVTAGISFRNNAFPELVSMLNPVYTFLEFLKMISNSTDLLLDLLVSNETCFLLYLLRFLKYIRLNWSMFVQSCNDTEMGTNMLDEAMSVLIRLRLQISRLVSRQLYPYDISPVLRLLESCEGLYEGNDLT